MHLRSDLRHFPATLSGWPSFMVFIVGEVRPTKQERTLAGVAIELGYGPARFSRQHDIGNLWPPLASKLRRHRGFNAEHAALSENIDQNAWVRNAGGAHYNPVASPVTPQEVQQLAGFLAELYEVMFCGGCRSFVRKQQNDDWRCVCSQVMFNSRPQ